ncbi:MAG: acetate--CoA ligase [Brumimicrobium sp.]|nr:acetate--CoA ligase [Brumimicrobium sp.]MCO5269580.1 acetate--CoA ligase [Brumimicrobium sp.]
MNYPYQIKTKEEYIEMYQKSVEAPETFWEEIAENFQWKKRWSSVLNWQFKGKEAPIIEWFKGAKLNITENCLDRHLKDKANQPAIIWEPNDPSEQARTLTYQELHDAVNIFANVLKNNGVKKGDRVCIYMGMIPELAISLLACARIGAIHSVIFGGFSAKSITDRVNDAQAKLVITCDASYHGKKIVPLKNTVDEALTQCDSVQKVLVYARTGAKIDMLEGRDYWWHDEVEKVKASGTTFYPTEEMDAEDPLYILYTSGSTGKPKGVVHTTAGYMVYTTYTFVNVFNYQPGEVFFCTADIGWVTGHSYIVYGPLSAGATTMMFEGVPTYPDAGRMWDIVDKHHVNILYTAPTAIRALMAHGLSFVDGKDLSSLRVLGSVGEPINEEAWHWYYDHIGKGKCPIVDTWWQTENGGVLISTLAHVTDMKPSYATYPLPGIQPAVMDEKGNEITTPEAVGNLCIKFPWPGMLRTTWGDHQRCFDVYFSAYPGMYFSGDGCLRESDGKYRITGRVDDVLNVSGHRIGTAEIENAINIHQKVVESAVVGFPHDIKGQGIYAFVLLDKQVNESEIESCRTQIIQSVRDLIGPLANPDKIQFVKDLPKTRSGKIMRRILRKIAEGEMNNVGDITTLLNPDVVEDIKKNRCG